ncbi:formylglycine-generating enzyme family protein [Arenimonas sp.]|uniref:formylglycine-generating enzyme family protein n=1 Tax=Arenimonas sp. TaxID=1872635 RepID=UPI0039E38D29
MMRLRSSCLVAVLLLSIAGCRQAEPPSAERARATGTPKPSQALSAPASETAQASEDWRPVLPVLDAAQVARTLRQAGQSLDAGLLERGASPGPGALELYLAVLAIEPQNSEAQEGLHATLDALLERGRIAMRVGDLKQAGRIDRVVGSSQPEHSDLAGYREHLVAARKAQALLDTADRAARQGHFLLPAGGNAQESIRRARAIAPDYAPTNALLRRWHEFLLQRAWKAAGQEDYVSAQSRLVEARRWWPESSRNEVMALRILELRQALTEALLDQGNAAVDKLDLEQAGKSLAHVRRVAAQKAGPDMLRQRIYLARHYGLFVPEQIFAEGLAIGGKGPEMVVIAHGSFRMGSPDDERARQAVEGPQHRVIFTRGFAMARNETTVGQFRRFVVATGYRSVAERAGRSRVFDEKTGQMSERDGVNWRHDHVGKSAADDMPVLHVAFEDGVAYADWLSRQTGQKYRLPSEAEFEYVLRAGSAAAYPWGEGGPKRLVGNLTGEGDQSSRGRRWGNAVSGYRDGFWGPAPVRSFPPEAYGSFDLIGNAAEWTLDCWHDSYQRAPMDGSGWVNPGCRQRVVRGASWASALEQARSAFRSAMDAHGTSARTGFRVVREL